MEIIDCTYNIEEGMITFDAPWHTKVRIEQLGRIEEVGRDTRELTIGTHTGTHIDSPLHFIKNLGTIDTIPLDKLIGKVTIIDATECADNDSISVEFLKTKRISKRMIFKFGWGKHWGQKEVL